MRLFNFFKEWWDSRKGWYYPNEIRPTEDFLRIDREDGRNAFWRSLGASGGIQCPPKFKR